MPLKGSSRLPSRAAGTAPCRNRLRVTMGKTPEGDGGGKAGYASSAQQGWLPLRQFDDQFAEQRIGPGIPGPGEMRRIVLVESLVHEAAAGMRGIQTRKRT